MRNKIFRIITIAFIAIASAITGVLVWKSWQSYEKIIAPPPKVSKYAKFQAKTFPGSDYANRLIQSVKTTNPGWNEEPSSNNVSMEPDNCMVVPPAQSMLVQKKLISGNGSIVIQVYGAGQARAQYNAYASSLSSCYSDMSTSDNRINYKDGSIMTYGDSIVAFLGDSSKNAGLVDNLEKTMKDTLIDTSCLALNETDSDSKRSFYYDQNAFTGLIKQDKVTVNTNYIEPSVPQPLLNTNMNLNGVFPDPTVQAVSQPESPLPSGMESKIPTAPAMPSISSEPARPSNTTTISYQVADVDGPGCGWTWSGQTTPEFDTKTLDANHKTLISNAKNQLTANINSYNKSVTEWSQKTMQTMSFTTQWDDYSGKTDAIYASWKTLNNARDVLKPDWDAYIQKWKDWSTWDSRKSSAANDYSKALQQCVTDKTKANTNANNNKPSPGPSPSSPDNPSPSPSPSPSTPTPDYQKECEQTVSKPDILSQQKPDKPDRPSIPNGVTIPDSWEKDSN